MIIGVAQRQKKMFVVQELGFLVQIFFDCHSNIKQTTCFPKFRKA